MEDHYSRDPTLKKDILHVAKRLKEAAEELEEIVNDDRYNDVQIILTAHRMVTAASEYTGFSNHVLRTSLIDMVRPEIIKPGGS